MNTCIDSKDRKEKEGREGEEVVGIGNAYVMGLNIRDW